MGFVDSGVSGLLVFRFEACFEKALDFRDKSMSKEWGGSKRRNVPKGIKIKQRRVSEKEGNQTRTKKKVAQALLLIEKETTRLL